MNQLLDENGCRIPLNGLPDWEVKRSTAIAAMSEVMGSLPGDEKRIPLDVKFIEDRDCGSYLRRFISYASEPDSRVPAFLLIPKDVLLGERKAPGLICAHGASWDLGHRSMDLPDHLPGKEWGQGWGSELAQRGYVVLCPAYPMQGSYFPKLESLGYVSGSMKAVWDNVRGIDLLESMPEVLTGEYGMVGASQGGYNTAFTAVFEPRIKAVSIAIGFDSFQVYKYWDQNVWFESRHMPRLATYERSKVPFDFHDVIASIAPRPCYVSAPKEDFFHWESAAEIVDAARGVYQLYQASEALRIEHPDCGHSFRPSERENAYQNLDRTLGLTPSFPMLVPLMHVDAFTSRTFAGNPAGVCMLPHWLTDERLQVIAAEVGTPATAFLVKNEEQYEIRWFTPITELQLCGHATLASAHALCSRGTPPDQIRFASQSAGILTVNREGATYSMDFPVTRTSFIEDPELQHKLSSILGNEVLEMHQAGPDILVLVKNEDVIKTINPVYSELAKHELRGLIVTAPGDDVDFVSRFFAPRLGVDEDHVTGSAHCALAPFWSDRLHRSKLRARQCSIRGGDISCHVNGERVLLGGEAVLVFTGLMNLPTLRDRPPDKQSNETIKE